MMNRNGRYRAWIYRPTVPLSTLSAQSNHSYTICVLLLIQPHWSHFSFAPWVNTKGWETVWFNATVLSTLLLIYFGVMCRDQLLISVSSSMMFKLLVLTLNFPQDDSFIVWIRLTPAWHCDGWESTKRFKRSDIFTSGCKVTHFFCIMQSLIWLN